MSDIVERARKIAAGFEDDMIDFAQRIIRCPSLTGQEEAVSKIIEAELNKLSYDEVIRDAWGNMIGIVHGTEDGPSIMYNAHQDHVDIGNVAEWEGYEPYGGLIDEAKIQNETCDGEDLTKVIHGRAASDTKGGLACQVYAGGILAALKKEGYSFKGNFIFTASVMEEPAEQIGMRGMLDHTFPERGIAINGVVSCEATGLRLYLGHRGRVEIRVEVKGITSHGSTPWLGVNAVSKAAALIRKVDKYYANYQLTDSELGPSSNALTIISCSPANNCVVPDRCELTYDRRIIPGETPEEALNQIRSIIKELQQEDPEFRAEVREGTVPRTTYTGITEIRPSTKKGWKISTEHPFVKACAEALRELGEPVNYGYWYFGTDLDYVCADKHIPAVGYSPMQELYCHRPVDKVRIDFMERALVGNVAIFEKLVTLPSGALTL